MPLNSQSSFQELEGLARYESTQGRITLLYSEHSLERDSGFGGILGSWISCCPGLGIRTVEFLGDVLTTEF